MPVILGSIQINSCVFSRINILADTLWHQMNSLWKCGSHRSLLRERSTLCGIKHMTKYQICLLQTLSLVAHVSYKVCV